MINNDQKSSKSFFLHNPLGMTLIIDLMTRLRKPLIFHNGLHDIMYIYNSFIADLPEDADDFKSEITRLFPQIYDTRQLLNNRKLLRGEMPEV